MQISDSPTEKLQACEPDIHTRAKKMFHTCVTNVHMSWTSEEIYEVLLFTHQFSTNTKAWWLESWGSESTDRGTGHVSVPGHQAEWSPHNVPVLRDLRMSPDVASEACRWESRKAGEMESLF